MTTIHSRESWKVRLATPCAPRTAASIALLFAMRAEGQEQPPVKGVVSDSAARVGLNAVEVRLEGTAQRVFTDSHGAFRVAMSAPTGRLVVRRLGFRPDTVDVRSGDASVLVVLSPAAQPLERVVVRAAKERYIGRLAGYYERLELRTRGQFITRADLEREKPPQLTDMLQRQPGVHLSRGRPGPARLRMRGRECLPLVWLDGAALSGGDVDLDAFAPTTLEGIELYLGGNAPARYQGVRGQSECGIIMLWSRGPDTEPKRLGNSITPEELEQLITAQTIYTADQVDSVAQLEPAHRPDIAYPPSLRAAKVEGTVLVEFVVDTLGRVEPERFGIVGSSDPLFSDAVRAAIRGAMYTPAVRRGRRVRQLVRQPFEFRLPPADS